MATQKETWSIVESSLQELLKKHSADKETVALLDKIAGWAILLTVQDAPTTQQQQLEKKEPA